MYKYMSLSRAARLVGVKRGTLQKRIQAGEIKTFEGELLIEDLLRAYPDADLEDSTMLEHTRKIKDRAVGRIYTDNAVLPSSETLNARVQQLGAELAAIRAQNEHYASLIARLKEKLQQGGSTDNESLGRWLDQQLDPAAAPVQPATSKLVANDTLLRLMTAHVRILPSGHDFFVEGASSLLEAGLRAGLALDYACSNGNCGKCKARLLSGEIEKIRNHDYALSETEKTGNAFLMCCNAAVTDVVIEAVEAHGVEDIPRQQIDTRVRKIEFPNDHVALLHLKTPRTNRLRFLAGQYASLQADGDAQATDVSIASCPCDDMNLHFQIPRNDSPLSQHVFNDLKTGDTLHLQGPAGDFVLDEESFNSLAFICCNTGFAPVKSLIEHAMALDIAENIHLFWITADAEDRYLDNLCRSWDDALDNFYFHPIDSSLANAGEAGAESKNVMDIILQQLEQPAGYDFYIAGNTAIIGTCRASLLERGVAESQLKIDNLNHE